MLADLFFNLCRKWGLSDDLGLVLLSDRLLFFALSDPSRIVEHPFEERHVTPELPPARLPEDVCDGLTTRVHLGECERRQPIFERGELLDFSAAEDTIREAIAKVTSWKSRVVKPRVVCCIPWDRHQVRNRAWLEVVERAGARQIYLTRIGIVTAMGLGLNILEGNVYGILLVERDWTVFAVISYADEIAYHFIPIGSEDVSDPEVQTVFRSRLLDGIAATLAELRPIQSQKLSESGVYCTGDAATENWVAMMEAELGIVCKPGDQEPHPAVVGLQQLVSGLDQFKQLMGTKSQQF